MILKYLKFDLFEQSIVQSTISTYVLSFFVTKIRAILLKNRIQEKIITISNSVLIRVLPPSTELAGFPMASIDFTTPVCCCCIYRAASEGWQPPMSIEDTRESPLAQKCCWHRIIPEVGGHFDPCTKQGTPTTRRRPPLVGLEKCSQMHKRG